MPLSGATITAALRSVGAIGGQLRSPDELAAGANAALRLAPAGLTVPGAASYLATQAQESAYLRTTREYGSDQPYAPWIGRTFEQLTHQEAHARFGAWCRARGLVDRDDAFVRNPAALEDYRFAWLGGVFYFEWRNLWPIANRGDHYGVSQIVNRGPAAYGTSKPPMHWTERNAMYRAFLAAGTDLLPSGTPAPAAGGCAFGATDDPATRAWQTYLRDFYRDYAGTLVPDGHYREATRRATAEFQARVGITGPDADGRTVGPRTLTAARARGFRG